jgi:hypothetical protein
MTNTTQKKIQSTVKTTSLNKRNTVKLKTVVKAGSLDLYVRH